MKKGRTPSDFPPKKNPTGHVPHVIDWDKVREAIQNMSQEEIDALIQASHGSGGGID